MIRDAMAARRQYAFQRVWRAIFAGLIAFCGLAAAQVPPSPREIAAYTGLHAAAHQGNMGDLGRLLAVPGVIVDARDGYGRTPLHVATFARQREAIRALVAAGANTGTLERDRYDAVMDDLQMIGQHNMLCGMHVHVELPDPDERVNVMTRMLPYLPLIIALATSSPFWRSRPTGLKGYRLAAYDELPRTGVPELFHTKEEFEAYVDALVKADVMQDANYI